MMIDIEMLKQIFLPNTLGEYRYDIFLIHTITSSVVILFVYIISHIFEKKISPCIKYALWLLVVIKLLLPIPDFESKYHILNFVENPVVNENIYEWTNGKDEKVEFLNTERENSTLGESINTDAEIAIKTEENQMQKDSLEMNYEGTEAEQENSSSGINGTDNLVDMKNNEDREKSNTSVSVGNLFANVLKKLLPIIRLIYISGVLVCSTVFVCGNICFHKYLRKKGKYIKAYKNKIPMYRIEDYYGACLYGGVKPIIIVGNNKGLSIEQQHMVLTHEYVHYLHGDHIWSLVRCICLALYWYNPLIWLAAFASREDGELACDQGTLKRIGKKQRIVYGKSLLEIAKKSAEFKDIARAAVFYSTTAAGGKNEMKKRITLIAGETKKSVIALIAVIILSVGCIGCTFGKPVTETSVGESDSNVSQELNTDENIDEQQAEVNVENQTAESFENNESTDELIRKYPNLYTEPQEDKVCIIVQPSEVREQLEYYYIPEGDKQEELKEIMNTLEMLDKEEKSQLLTGIKKGKVDSHWSWNIIYNGKKYDVYGEGYFSSRELEGEIVGPYVYYDQKQELYEKINDLLVRDLDYGYVDISTIKDIVSATLTVKAYRTDHKLYSQTITDAESLKKLEQWFSNAKPVPGVYDCECDGASLVLKTASGEDIKTSLAADSCTLFAVNGVFYDYRPKEKVYENWDSEQVYGLFDQIPNAFKEEEEMILEEIPGTDSSADMQEIKEVNSEDLEMNVEEWATETVLEMDEEVNTFVWPTKSTTVSTNFGIREHPLTGEKKVIDHIGIAGNEGDLVYAVADGYVTDVGIDENKGVYIVLTAKTGEIITYGHLDGSKVPKNVPNGQEVKAGEIIGLMGKTGNATGVFLSLSVEADGEMVDPMNYFE